jgi:hypothetical protein
MSHLLVIPALSRASGRQRTWPEHASPAERINVEGDGAILSRQ